MPSIHLTEDQVRHIVWEDSDQYLSIEEDVDYEGAYKDYASASAVFQDIFNGKYYELHYSRYTSHYGDGENQYEAQDCPEVHLVTKEVTTIVKSWEVV
jgi:hypothetical protein